MTESLYQTDYYHWTQQQSGLLKAGRLNDLDAQHLIEELESMGARERRELINRLTLLQIHLLKWLYQPERQGSSWLNIIRGQRMEITDLISDNPSLKSEMEQAVIRAYKKARFYAANETGLSEQRFPEHSPFMLDQLFDDDFWPDELNS